MNISNFEDLEKFVKERDFKARCAVAGAADAHVLQAVMHAAEQGVVFPILIGNRAHIEELLRELGYQDIEHQIIHETDGEAAYAQWAVDLVNDGKADYIMKGLLNTASLMRVVFKKENKLRTGRIATSVSIRKIPAYHKLLAFTDAGICVSPSLEDKKMILQNGLALMHKLGVEVPKVAVLAAVDTVNEKMPETVDAAELKRLAENGEFGRCLVEGPISFDLAFSKEAAQTKRYESPVAGDADLMLFPNVAAGNMTTKAIDLTSGSTGAGLIVGAKIPLVFSSRSATAQYKYQSILLASAVCE